MTHVPAAMKLQVEQRAGGKCEYCHLSQAGQEARFHVDHILPSMHGGHTILDNLSLACVSCSLRKGAKTEAVDPASDTLVPIFNPRQDDWSAHFRWEECHLQGLTTSGRATVAALRINRPLILEIRREEQLRGRHPF